MVGGGQEQGDIAGGRHIASSTVGVVLRYVRRVAGSAAAAQVLAMAGLDPDDPRPDDPSTWMTYPEAVRVFEAAAEITADPDVAIRAGEELLAQYAGSEVAALLRSLGSPMAVIENVAVTASKFSTVITAAMVDSVDGGALVEARAVPPFERSPHFCKYMAGVLSQATALFGLAPAPVAEVECQRRGDDRCLYRVELDVPADDAPDARIARLENDLAMLEARFESLRSTATELVSATGVEDVLAIVTRRAMEAVRAPQFLLAVRVEPDAPLRIHHEGFVSDAAAREHVESHLAGDRPAAGSLLVVDVATALNHFGFLAAAYPGAGGFLPLEEELLTAYASHAAAALEIAAALEQTRRKNEAARALLAMASTLARARTEREVAESLVATVPGVVGSTVVTVLLRQDPSAPLRFVAAGGLPTEIVDALLAFEVRPGDSTTLTDLYARPGPMVLDRTNEDPFLQGLFELVGNERAAIVPVVVQGEVLGVIGTDLVDDAPPGDILERLEGLADQASTALLNVRLLATVRDQALCDSLTGLPNARAITERTAQAVGRSSGGDRMALLFIDLDHFKPVNDTFGHAVGDEVLRMCAERLGSLVRGDDVVARLGGDEFLVLLHDLDRPEQAEAAAARLCAAIDQPFDVGGSVVRVSSSIGIALFPDHGRDFDALVRRADAAMYTAKASRRGAFAVADS